MRKKGEEGKRGNGPLRFFFSISPLSPFSFLHPNRIRPENHAEFKS